MRDSTGLWAVLVLLFLGAVAGAAVPETGASDSRLASFDRLMTDFVAKYHVPGASLAVARQGKLVYARGFGYAGLERKTPVEPTALFRIASISKPITSAAVLQLMESKKLRMQERAFPILHLAPHLEPGQQRDSRLAEIDLFELLHHSGGFDRDKSFDPMFDSVDIANALHVAAPANQEAIIRYMLGRPLDFNPGTREAYSNFGYCVLGRVIERASGESYEQYVREHVLRPLGIHDMRLGHTLLQYRAPGEVRYYDEKNRTGPCVFPPNLGKPVPLPYGAWDLEAMDSHGGWLASAVDLVRFASSMDDRMHCPILAPHSIDALFARPRITGYDADGKPKDAYYGCGWEVRPVGKNGKLNTWHNGILDGTSTLLVRRFDGLTWAVLFNTRNSPDGKPLCNLIDGPLHTAADQVKQWPEIDLFARYLGSGR